MNDATSVRGSVRTFILENFLFTEDGSELKDGASFMEEGIVDSTGIMEVIAFIEDEFDIQVEDSELVPENLDSVDNLVKYVTSKTD